MDSSMNSSSASRFMDKQVMDLFNSQNHNSGGENDFLDFNNNSSQKKDEMFPSYNFMPVRPDTGSLSPSHQANRTSNFDSAEDDASLRTWNSLDSKTNPSFIRNYGSLDAGKPSKSMDLALISEIDKTVKKYTDNLMHAMDNVSSRISQLETRTRSLENSMDDLKVSIGDNHGSSDGKLRQMENILREVQTGVHIIRDKQDVIEAQIQTSKRHFSNSEHGKSQNGPHSELSSAGMSPPNQQFSTLAIAQQPPTLPSPNAPLGPPPQPQVPFPSQYPQNQILPVPQSESYFPTPGKMPENPSHPYAGPPPPHHHQPPPPLQLQTPPQTQYPQPHPPSQPHPTYSAIDPSQISLGHRLEETPYPPPQKYPPAIQPPAFHPSMGPPPPQPSEQFYYPKHNVPETQSNRPGSGYSSSYGPSSGERESYPYNLPSQYSMDSPRKENQIPTARILPQGIPTASSVGSGSGNKVPLDDVVDKVTHMGFPRDQVRATVRKLTENGQAVDLNIVLDKLMNDSGWIDR